MFPAVAFLHICLAAFLLTFVPASCQEAVFCPCGTTGTNYTFRNVHLLTREDVCRTWSKCLKCQDEVYYCLECPVGLFGPTCTQFSCPDPGSVPNAERINTDGTFSFPGTTYHPGQSIEFTCHSGFAIHGASVLTCHDSGTWSGKKPTCLGMEAPRSKNSTTKIRRARNTDSNFCPDPGVPLDGVRTVNRPVNIEQNASAFPRGSHLTFRCNNNDFHLEGWDSLVCLNGGKWSSPLPTCVPWNPKKQRSPDAVLKNCPNPGPFVNGKVEVTKPKVNGERPPLSHTLDEDTYPPNTWVIYTCKAGYEIRKRNYIVCDDTGVWSQKPPICTLECGLRYKTEATVEKEASYGEIVSEWPWMVGVASVSNMSSKIICGGVLLNSRTIITAATCFTGNNASKLLFGRYRSRTEDDDEVIERSNFIVDIHPNFNNRTYTPDIALVHFWPSLRFSEHIEAICLPTNDTTAKNVANGRNGYVTSFGLTKNLKAPDTYMMSLHSVVTMHSCNKVYEGHNLTLPNEPEVFCAEDTAALTNICYEDGGSPMAYFGYLNKLYILEGLASFRHSKSCDLLRRYTAFTKVLPYVPWIMENLTDDLDTPETI